MNLEEIRAEVQEALSSGGGLPMKFPMWLIPGSVLAQLEHPLLPHEMLLQQGKLVRWEPGHPRMVVFISHEWLGTYHPDRALQTVQSAPVGSRESSDRHGKSPEGHNL